MKKSAAIEPIGLAASPGRSAGPVQAQIRCGKSSDPVRDLGMLKNVTDEMKKAVIHSANRPDIEQWGGQKAIRIRERSLEVIDDVEYADASLSKSKRATRRLPTTIQDNAWERFCSRDVLRRDLKG